MPVKKLKAYLDDNRVRYVTIIHSPAYTSQEIAASAHIPGKELAKTVMVKVDGKMAMAVLPASFRVDFPTLKSVTGAHDVALASEEEFKGMFPDCEPGAMPPFGNLWGMDVFVAGRLAEDEEIVFNAGSHIELMRLAYRDFARLVNPKVVEFSTR
ncbi:YbaK/EbsC family protein [Acidobacteria bacterium ACD]|nr:MAG: deacylase [Acidobacteriota bacterium]MCE7957076.1 deacylase [Acidobacteria bacterium ACB2]MDL1951381.1 YbaK/EbsC family protein [Acidobacteria bacterium ACD]